MLRIDTVLSGATLADIKLSGRLVSEASRQLHEDVGPHLRAGRAVRLDLSEIVSADRQAVALLLSLAREGARFFRCPSFLTVWLRAEARANSRHLENSRRRS